MSPLQIINVGAFPNDATGDPIQTAFEKCNANFTQFGGTLNPFTPTVPGLVPASGGGTATALRADGAFTSTFTGTWTFPIVDATVGNIATVSATTVIATNVNTTNITTGTFSLTTLNAANVVASSQVTIGPSNVPAYDSISGNIGYYARTAAEISQGVTPVNFVYAPGDSRRMSPDTTGITDVTTKIQNLLDVAGIAALDGEVRVVTLQPGTYKVTRLYMHYSNIWLFLAPGATIIQTLTGIINSNTTGVAPAYAVIHINPLNYVVNPTSGSAGQITNVRIYGGGTVQGPNTTNPGSYQQYQLGISVNDCTNCWIDGILIQGCGGESLLMGPSSWFTNTNLKLTNCEILQGGEVGFNNCRASSIIGNYFHDNWFQNGMGINGDNCIMAFNRIRNIQNSGIDLGGSGARDINTARDILVMGNVVTATGLSNSGSYQAFFTDDGATTVPKTNIKIIGNIFDNHIGPDQIAFDYNSGNNIEFVDNVVTNLQGISANAINVIAGSASYIFRGNVVNPGTLGNAIIGLTVSSAGTPNVTVEESNSITGFSSGNINWSSSIILNAEFDTNTTLVLTGFASGQNVPIFIVKKGNIVTINFTGTTATSNSITMTLGTLASYLRPTRTQNFLFPVVDNGINSIGILQISSSGIMSFSKDINGSSFTNSGNKGIVGPYNITYLLT